MDRRAPGSGRNLAKQTDDDASEAEGIRISAMPANSKPPKVTDGSPHCPAAAHAEICQQDVSGDVLFGNCQMSNNRGITGPISLNGGSSSTEDASEAEDICNSAVPANSKPPKVTDGSPHRPAAAHAAIGHQDLTGDVLYGNCQLSNNRGITGPISLLGNSTSPSAITGHGVMIGNSGGTFSGSHNSTTTYNISFGGVSQQPVKTASAGCEGMASPTQCACRRDRCVSAHCSCMCAVEPCNLFKCSCGIA